MGGMISMQITLESSPSLTAIDVGKFCVLWIAKFIRKVRKHYELQILLSEIDGLDPLFVVPLEFYDVASLR